MVQCLSPRFAPKNPTSVYNPTCSISGIWWKSAKKASLTWPQACQNGKQNLHVRQKRFIKKSIAQHPSVNLIKHYQLLTQPTTMRFVKCLQMSSQINHNTTVTPNLETSHAMATEGSYLWEAGPRLAFLVARDMILAGDIFEGHGL